MNNQKPLTPQEEYERNAAETTDLITAEDLIEQVVYAANAPDCCSPGEKAENMLNMLGANIADTEIYHTEDAHPEDHKENHGKEIKITCFDGNTVALIPELVLYSVSDFMGEKQKNIGLNLYISSENGLEPYAALTKNFNEFIGMKNCSYVDTNNCCFAEQLLKQGIAKDTGLTKHSGYCIYPLWQFDNDFLKTVDCGLYDLYSSEFDRYMNPVAEDMDQELKM